MKCLLFWPPTRPHLCKEKTHLRGKAGYWRQNQLSCCLWTWQHKLQLFPHAFLACPQKCWVARGLGCSDGLYVAKSHRREEEEGEENLHKKVWIPFSQSSTGFWLKSLLQSWTKGGISFFFFFFFRGTQACVCGINWSVRCWWRSSLQSVVHGNYCLPPPFLCFRLYIALY